MKVTLERVISIAPYETLRFGIEVDSMELPGISDLSVREQAAMTHRTAYAEVLRFEVSHGHLTVAKAVEKMAHYDRVYGTQKPAVLA